MKKMQLLLVLFCTLCLLVCGCGKTPAVSEPTASAAEAPTGPYPRTDGVTLEALICVEPSMKSVGLTYADSPVWQAWQEKTGVSLSFSVVSDATALTMALATGTFPDIFWLDAASFHGGIDRMVAEGMAIDLSPYAAEMPDYLQVVGKNDAFRKSVSGIDGKLYAFGHLLEADTPLLCTAGMVVRKDALDALEMDIPTTTDAFTKMLGAFRKELKYTVPLSAANWERMLTDGFLTSGVGLTCAGLYQNNGVCAFGAAEPAYQKALLTLKGWHDDGYLPAEPDASAVERLLDGRCAAAYLTESELETVLTTAKASGQALELVGIPSLGTATNAIGAFCAKENAVSGKNSAFITKDCAHPEAAAAFLNWLYTAEGTSLANFGAYRVADGWKIHSVLPEDVLQNKQGLSALDALSAYTLAERGTVQRLAVLAQCVTDASQVAIQTAWAQTDVDAHTVQGQETERAAWGAIHSLVTQWSYDFLLGNRSVQKEFQDYLAELETAGLPDLLAEAQQAYDAWLAR